MTRHSADKAASVSHWFILFLDAHIRQVHQRWPATLYKERKEESLAKPPRQ